MIELIVVLVVLGILSYILVSRVADVDEGRLGQAVTRIRTHYRYAQERAMKGAQVWGISADSSGYFLFHDDISKVVPLPGEDNGTVSFSDMGVLSDITASPGVVVYFNAYGIPYLDSSLSTKVDNATNAVKYTVSLENDNSKHAIITVTPETGFIP